MTYSTAQNALDQEKILICTLLHNPDEIPKILEIVSPDDFRNDAAMGAFKGMSHLAKKGTPVDLVTVGQYITTNKIGHIGWLAEAADLIPSRAALPMCAKAIAESGTQKRIYHKMRSILGEIKNNDPGTSLEQLEMLFNEEKLRISGTRKSDGPQVKAVPISDFLQTSFPPRENILSPWLPIQGLAMIYAMPGVGKTHVSLGIACAVAAGDSFLNWRAPKPAGVLFIDGEMPAATLQARLSSFIGGMENDITAPLKIITPDLQENGMPDLATIEGQQAISKHITDDIRLVILDNLSTLINSGKENTAEDWRPIQTWALRLRAQGRSVLFIHHSNKAGGQRGTSKKADILDTVINLRHPGGHKPEDGACFQISFEKARGIAGQDVKSFEAKLTTGEGGISTWTTRTLQESTYDRVVMLANDGLTASEIAEEIDKHKSSVSRHLKKARENGDVLNEK